MITLISLHPHEYRQELHYYTFALKLDRCTASCITLSGLSTKVSVSYKT